MILVSIIIPTLNRSTLLHNTLVSIARQTADPGSFEVIVIDNGSTDATHEVVTSFSDKLKHLSYYRVTAPGLHEGRHAGMKASKGDLLVFADDDIEANPEWIDGIKESFQDQQVGLVGGNNLPLYESDPPPWVASLWVTNTNGLFMTHYSLLNFGDEAKEIHPHFVFGCNFAIRKNILLRVGGFHPDGMPGPLLKFRGDGETYVAEQVQALGYKTMFNPRASVYHVVPASRMSIDYLKKRAYAEGITQSYIDTRYKRKVSSGFLASLRRLVRQTINLSNPIEHAVQQSFQEGYKFHQQELKKDKELAAWVAKENYL